MPRKKQNTNDRFDAKVHKGDSCWEWVAAMSDFGYGLFHLNGGNVRAHRFSYERSFGPVPDGMYVLHRCDNPKCVRPAHLFLGTLTDNSRDMVDKGRMRGGRHNATHCPSGHEYNDANTYVYRGRRCCKECNRHRAIRYYHKEGKRRRQEQVVKRDGNYRIELDISPL